MKISCARPVGGRRELICRGDEATVSRVRGVRGYAGMVERLQRIPSYKEAIQLTTFNIWTARHGDMNLDIAIRPDTTTYHLLRFVSLRFAKAIFPENFVDCHEIRFFREEGHRYAATYSDFVPDDNGVVQRRKRYAEAFYAEEDEEQQEKIRERMHEKERKMNPSLVPTVRDLREVGGIILAHPEANYHLSDGSLVFFEIEGIDIWDASAFSYNDEIQGYLSLFYAIVLRQASYHIMDNSSRGCYREAAAGFAACDFDELVRIAHFILYKDSKKMLEEFGCAIKNGIEHYRKLKSLWRGMLVNEEAIKDIDRIMRDDF